MMPTKNRTLDPFVMTALSLVSSCGSQAPRSETLAVREPSASTQEVATPLGERRARLLHAVHDAVRSASAEWGFVDAPNPCTLIFNQDDEWLSDCGDSVEGFLSTQEATGSGTILWHAEPLFLSGQQIPYEQVALSIVGTVGERTTDSGETLPVLILQDWDVLHQNHPGFQQSQVSEWLGVAVHEGFHAHQMRHPNVRPKLSLIGAEGVSPEALSALYRENTELHAMVQEEFELLSTANRNAPSADLAQRTLRQWNGLYQRRAAFLERTQNTNFVRSDAFLTFLEGTARYVEARYLTNPPRSRRNVFAAGENQGGFPVEGTQIVDLPGIGGIGNRYFYSLGMHLSLLLDVARPNWKREVLQHEGLLIGLVQEHFAAN